jgi:hypothetical protein
MIVLITIFIQDRNRDNNRLCHRDRYWWKGHASRTRMRQTSEIALIKLSTLRDNDLLGTCVAKLPILVPIRVTNEDTLLLLKQKR